MELNLDAINPLYEFDVKSRRYRFKDTGKFLSNELALTITARYIEREKERLIALAEELENGDITLFQFQLRATEHLKHIHVSQAVIGADGSNHITSNDFLWIGRNLKKQYYSGIGEDGKRYGIKYLAMDIEAGTVTPGKLRQRLSMYADSGQAVYWQMKRTRAVDKPYEYRELDPSANHCQSCIFHASLGVKPIGVLPLPTMDCTCFSRCRCSLIQISLEEAITRGIEL